MTNDFDPKTIRKSLDALRAKHGAPLPKPKVEVVAEYSFLDDLNGGLWIDVEVNRYPCERLGPFDTEGERQKALDDLLGMMRSQGAKDLPATHQ